ncbi:MAG TPA: adenylate/guanylate cyclase domain-containing protein [Ktedonobacterales bacterium]|nr:adenylate/guanylate cyclase domain-containing protein [Ktedonobacterales bacterium]
MTALPSGTVTFLFSDIEGSTRLLQQLGPRYAPALEEHQRLLRDAWAAHQGVEVDTQGDSFFVAFSRATDAVAAAIEATRALAAHPWPDNISVTVRIGLHTGSPTLAGDDGKQYVGLDVHRAARIAAAGHGGQIILSQTTRDLCESALPDELVLGDLGEARLKDLPRPEHLYQVIAPDLPHAFPPLKTLDRVRNNLPLQPTPFLGRESVLQRLVALLAQDDVRVLTLMGPGGIGKTRVALEVAAQVAESYPDGVYFVTLSPLTEPALVADTVARELGLRTNVGIPAEEQLQAALAHQRTLLVVDNFESVVSAAPVIARLVAACPDMKTLVTSRIALRLRGEHEYTIPPLETPDPAQWSAPGATGGGSAPHLGHATPRPIDLEQVARYPAITLFIERAREVKPDFRLTNANAPAIIDICRQLDGLPLAIELAAARLRLLSPQTIRARLSKRLELLTDGPRDQPERQQTMRATIGWSYDLLRPEERAVFRRMSVFTGGWTLEAAETVCAPALDALNGLSALIDHSLIGEREEEDNSDEGETRYWQLETIQAFAAAELEASGEADAIRAAHASYFLELAERTQREARGPDAQVWLRRLERELNNFRSALSRARDTGDLTPGLRLATALSGFWHSHGHEREGARWLQEFLTLAEPRLADEGAADDQLRAAHAWGLVRAGALVAYLADYPRATALIERGLAAERMLGDRERELRALLMLGVAAQLHDDLDAAASWYEEGLTIARSTAQDDLATSFLNNLGDVAYYRGDLTRALDCYSERLDYGERNGDRAAVVVGQQNIGRTLLRQGQIEQAAQALHRSLDGAWRLGDPRRVAEGLEGMAALAGTRGEADRAARLLGAAAQLRESLGTPQPLPERKDIEAAVANARAEMDANTWSAAITEGHDLPIEEVISAALEGSADA